MFPFAVAAPSRAAGVLFVAPPRYLFARTAATTHSIGRRSSRSARAHTSASPARTTCNAQTGVQSQAHSVGQAYKRGMSTTLPRASAANAAAAAAAPAEVTAPDFLTPAELAVFQKLKAALQPCSLEVTSPATSLRFFQHILPPSATPTRGTARQAVRPRAPHASHAADSAALRTTGPGHLGRLRQHVRH